MIYLDYASTTPILPEVWEAMAKSAQESFGNPASSHAFGAKAREAMEAARERIALALGALPEEIIFTSGGTESNHLALAGIGRALPEQKRKLLVSEIEHKSVLKAAQKLALRGVAVELLPVERLGVLSFRALKDLIDEHVGLVSVMWVNNELGTIQPIAEVALLCQERGAFFHCDASQALLTEEVNVQQTKVDALTLSAHKLYGPKGVGVLYLRKGVPLEPLFVGGGQERERRAGTPNVPGIVGMAKAIEICGERRVQRREHFETLRELLLREIRREPDLRETVEGSRQASHFVHFLLERVSAQTALVALDLSGFAVSTGAACSSGYAEPSHVLQALGLTEQAAQRGLRVVFGESTKEAEVDLFVQTLTKCLHRWRETSPVLA